MTENVERVAGLMARFRNEFYETREFYEFEARINMVLHSREALLCNGITQLEGACLLGPSKSGKTTIIKKILGDFEADSASRVDWKFGDTVKTVLVPPGAGVKQVYIEIIKKINGYEVAANRTEDYLKSLVTNVIREERVAALYLDELQDLGRLKSDVELRKFMTSLRHLMQLDDWPVALIISGTPDLSNAINSVDTLATRLLPKRFERVTEDEKDLLIKVLVDFAKIAEVQIEADLWEDEDFRDRLMHAGNHYFGRIVRVISYSICEAALDPPVRGVRHLSYRHFVRGLFKVTQAGEENNIFLVDDWSTIDPRKLYIE